MKPLPVTVLRGHTSAVTSLAVLNDKILASGALDGGIQFWDVYRRRAFSRIASAHSRGVLSLDVLCSDNSCTQLVSGGRDGVVHLWDMPTATQVDPTPIRSFFSGATHFCNTVCDRHKKDGNLIISPSAEEKTIFIWDVRSPGDVPSAIVYPDTDTVPACEAQGGYRSDQLGMVTSLAYHSQLHPSSDILTSNGSIFAGYEGGVLRSIDLRNLKTSGYSCPPSSASTTSDGSAAKQPILALDVWDASNVSVSSNGGGCSGSGSTTGPQMLVMGGADSALSCSCWRDLGSHKSSSEIVAADHCSTVMLTKAGTNCVQFRPDGRILVSGHWDGSVNVYQCKGIHKTKKILQHMDASTSSTSVPPPFQLSSLGTLRYHREAVTSVSFFPCLAPKPPQARQTVFSAEVGAQIDCEEDTNVSGWFATGSKDGTIALWSVYADKLASQG